MTISKQNLKQRKQGVVRSDQDQEEKAVVNNVASLGLFWFGFVVVGSLGGQAIILLSGRLGTLQIVQAGFTSPPSYHAQHGTA